MLHKQFFTQNPNSADIETLNNNIASFLSGNDVKKIAIQAVPGQQFYVNSNSPAIVIGRTGIFMADYSNVSTLTSLSFEFMNTKYIMVDLFYEEQEVEQING